jgi:hypothetical protein
MSTRKTLVLIALGYVLATCAGVVAVAVNELRLAEDVSQDSSGMAAFGDLVLFVLVTGFFSLPSMWYLLRLVLTKRLPRPSVKL